jgi:phage FluMu protein Com
MPRTIQCTNCGVVLNLPEQAAGKRLKCPKCGTKFFAGSGDANTQSTVGRLPSASPDSSRLITGKQYDNDLPLPTAASEPRETFDLPLLTESAPSGPAKTSDRTAGDAPTLFEEWKSAPRRPTGAEARAKPRRCPTCGGVVPVGMSLCQSCGLDLDTGTRVALDDDLTPPPPPRPSGMPLNIMLVGGIGFLGSLVLTCYSVFQWLNHAEGWVYFVPVCLFAVYASVQFLRRKSVKMLLAALTLGVVVNVFGMIVVPIMQANADLKIEQRKTGSDDPNGSDIIIHSIPELINFERVYTGIGLLLLYALVSVYLISPSVSRYFQRR